MRLLLDITAHGLGHLAQCAPVVAALRAAEPLELVVRSGLPAAVLSDWLGPLLRHVPADTDFGAVMRDALRVDAAATFARYQALHRRLPDTVGALARMLREWQCDAVLSNASYIACAAAADAGIPCVLFSSLTWCDVLRACCPRATGLIEAMQAAYRRASRRLRLVPGTSFDGLDSIAVNQPIARRGRRRRRELAERLGVDRRSPLALLAFGGMLPAGPPPLATLPGAFHLLGPKAWSGLGVAPVDTLGMPFSDVLASVDVVVSKPGYGMVTELACSGTPSVLVARPDWPEEPGLSDWLRARAPCRVVDSWQDVTEAALQACLTLSPPAGPAPEPGGEAAVADAVVAAVRSGSGAC